MDKAKTLLNRLKGHHDTEPSSKRTPQDYQLSDEGYNASAGALDDLTGRASDHQVPPHGEKHVVSSTQHSHAWLESILPASTVDNLEARYHLGNYVLDRQTGEKTFETMSVYVRLGMHLLYYGSEQEKVLHWQKTLSLLEAQSRKMGAQYDAPESKAHIQPFIDSFQLGPSMSEMVKTDPADYATFNEFFGREIKESARPIADPTNDLVTSSPADCRLTVFPTIDLATKYWIKGFGFTLERLLGDAGLAQQFEGGSIAIARLAPQDYHRWHAPVSGTVTSVKEIAGAYYTVNPQAINEPGTLDVFCENRRSVMTIKRSTTGSPIAVIAVGAMLVGSIKYCESIPGSGTLVSQPGTQIKRGQCLGAFYYGGSTVIVLYPRGETTFDADLVANSCERNMETLVKVGWQIGSKGDSSSLPRATTSQCKFFSFLG